MNDLWAGMLQAFWMVVSFDPELTEITLRSLQVTLIALVIGTSFALPLAARYWLFVGFGGGGL